MVDEFDFSEEETRDKIVITIYGCKGDGKTALAFSLDGKIACISFDHKSSFVKKYMYSDDSRIKVFDATRYFRENVEDILKSSQSTYNYLQQLLTTVIRPKNPDWIVIDGLEQLASIAEFVMRDKCGLQPFQGVSNMNVWKIRKLVLRNIHQLALESSKKGVIYTTYPKKDEIVVDGSIVTKDDIPNYTDIVMQETDIVLFVYSKRIKDAKRFMYEVKSSKNDKIIKSGTECDWTDKKLMLNL